jgi:hypothetical protein
MRLASEYCIKALVQIPAREARLDRLRVQATMSVAYYARYGLLGATCGLAVAIVVLRFEPGAQSHSRVEKDKPVEHDRVVVTRSYLHATESKKMVDDQGMPDYANKSGVLEHIAITQFACGDIPSARETIARIQDPDLRDHALNHLFLHISGSDTPSRYDGPAFPTPLVVPPPSDIAATKQNREMALEAVDEAPAIIGAIQKPGMRAFAWDRVGELQSLYLDDQKGASASFHRAIEEAERIGAERGGFLDSIQRASVSVYHAAQQYTVWLVVPVLGFLGILVAEIVKPFGLAIAKGLGSEGVAGSISRTKDAAMSTIKRISRSTDPGGNESSVKADTES